MSGGPFGQHGGQITVRAEQKGWGKSDMAWEEWDGWRGEEAAMAGWAAMKTPSTNVAGGGRAFENLSGEGLKVISLTPSLRVPMMAWVLASRCGCWSETRAAPTAFCFRLNFIETESHST